MLGVFAAAIFLSATLLFLVQPMVAKLVLPLLGGTPSVWNTCMLFFQTVLLAGYAYAHGLSKVRSSRAQVIAHAVLCAGALATLPIGLPQVLGEPTQRPVLWLIGVLALTVGLPFAVLSTTGPLLQRWFSTTDHAAARDPYFLYAASNAGSLLALVGYPAVVEPLATLKQQRVGWSALFGVLVVLLIGAGVLSIRRRVIGAGEEPAAQRAGRSGGVDGAAPAAGRVRERVLWVLLAMAPSSLMLGVTTYISTDLAAVPLLWIIPLSIYLVTMIGAYSKFGPVLTTVSSRILPLSMTAVMVSILIQAGSPLLVLVGIHLLLLLAAGMACHGRLAAMRPDPSRLTEYFLWISVGGALGGVFNAIVAPLVFSKVYEYQIAMVLACGLGLGVGLGVRDSTKRGSRASGRAALGDRLLDFAAPVFVTGLLIAFMWAAGKLADRFGAEERMWKVPAIGFGFPVLVCFLLARWPMRFTLAIAGYLLIAADMSRSKAVLYSHRGFFGVLRVLNYDMEGMMLVNGQPQIFERRFRRLLHGSTTHGMQALEPERMNIPLTYYHPSGPAGLVVEELNDEKRLRRGGFVGLGAGTMAAYGEPGQHFTFFEIDPAMKDVALDPALFTYVTDSAAEIEFVMGDGRKSLADYRGETFDLLVLDAFSSDSIPVHLMTVEAVKLYMDRLSERGVLLVHVSNRHLDLIPLVRGIGMSLGLAGREMNDDPAKGEAAKWDAEGKYISTWVVLARREEDLAFLGPDARWLKFQAPKKPDPVWTDDFSNILDVMKWK